MALLQALLPMAAHLIPLPGGDDGMEDHPSAEEDSLAAVETTVDTIDADVELAREELIRSLEKGELELIVRPFGGAAGCAKLTDRCCSKSCQKLRELCLTSGFGASSRATSA
jgi:hypothetical protein